MEFKLTEGQQNAMDMVDWFMRNAQSPARAVLTGAAGCGKTTVLRILASRHGHPIVLAPTGKAALRVTEATGLRASTIHRWLYNPKEDDFGETSFSRRTIDELEIPENRLIVVDEASMVTSKLWEDLWDTCLIANVKILLVGDPFQLPPVEKLEPGQEAFSVLGIETYFRAHLDEVMRQALESPVLRAATMIRKGSPYFQAFEPLDWIPSSGVEAKAVEIYDAQGMVICHKNTTRHSLNEAVRNAKGLAGDVQNGEPLSVTKNNYDVELFNGETVRLTQWIELDDYPIEVIDRYKRESDRVRFGKALLDNGHEVLLCPEQIAGVTLKVGDKALEKAARNYYGKGCTFLHANLGYATTCHRAQGSEAGVVLIKFEDSVRINSPFGRRWVYTAVSRARDKVFYAMES